ncbi:hypothetical protein JCM11491_003766 [Sporobolomyces phaffii]
MAVNSTFRPRHDQPVTLAELSTIEPELLVNEITRLKNSLKHLRRSNDELEEFAREEDDAETKAEFVNTVFENRETISKQEERIEMIRLALEEQIGVQATNGHYASSRESDHPTSLSAAPTTTAAGAAAEAVGEAEDDEEVTGMVGATRRRAQQVDPESSVTVPTATDAVSRDGGDDAAGGVYL